MDSLANLLNNLKDYFNDFIGTAVPGTVFLAGAILLFHDSIERSALAGIWAEWAWLPGLAAILVCGHLMLGLFYLVRPDRSKPDFTKLGNHDVVRAFRKVMDARMTERDLAPVDFSFNDLRSLAMSICGESADIGRRFMFIALLCFGTGTAMVLLAALGLFGTMPILTLDLPMRILLVVLLLGAGVVVMNRGREFERRAYVVPFIVAIATLAIGPTQSSTETRKDV